MSIPLWCLLAAALLNFFTRVPLTAVQKNMPQGYDNNLPREQQTQLDERGKRVLAAHQNQLESFPVFAAAILVALYSGVVSPWVDYLAILFVAARLLYWYAYLQNLASLRSGIWIVGFFSSIALLCSPLWS